MCASFRVFSLNFEGDKLSPWPFFKGTIPIAVRDWRNGAAWLKPCKWDVNFGGTVGQPRSQSSLRPDPTERERLGERTWEQG